MKNTSYCREPAIKGLKRVTQTEIVNESPQAKAAWLFSNYRVHIQQWWMHCPAIYLSSLGASYKCAGLGYLKDDRSFEPAIVSVVPYRLCNYRSMADKLGTPPSDNSGNSRTVRRSYKVGEIPLGSTPVSSPPITIVLFPASDPQASAYFTQMRPICGLLDMQCI